MAEILVSEPGLQCTSVIGDADINSRPDWEYEGIRKSEITQIDADFYIDIGYGTGPTVPVLVRYCEARLPPNTGRFSVVFRNPRPDGAYDAMDVKEHVKAKVEMFQEGLDDEDMEWVIRELNLHYYKKFHHVVMNAEISQRVHRLVEVQIVFEKPGILDL